MANIFSNTNHILDKVSRAFVSLALAGVLAVGLCPAPALATEADVQGTAPQEWTGPFPDVLNVPTAWYYDSVCRSVELGLFGGYDDGRFGTFDSLTRAQLVTVLWRYAEPEAAAAYRGKAQNTTGMPDVKDDKFYTAAINWAVSYGYITGYENGTFGPSDPITAEQMCVILSRFFVGDPGDASSLSENFTDAGSISAWAREGCAWALENGIVVGYSLYDGTRSLHPSETVYRARAATILVNAIDGGMFQGARVLSDGEPVWVPEYEDAWVEDVAAYSEEVPIYGQTNRHYCVRCEEYIDGREYEHMLYHVEAGINSQSWRVEPVRSIIGYRNVEHPSAGHMQAIETDGRFESQDGVFVTDYAKVWVVDSAAYSEEVPVLRYTSVTVCTTCAAIITNNIVEHDKEFHVPAQEPFGWHSEYIYVIDHYDTVEHEAEGHWEYIPCGGHWE